MTRSVGLVMWATFSTICLLCVLSHDSFAQEEPMAEETEEEVRENEKLLGLFFGATTKFKDNSNETYFTMAIEYEYVKATWGPLGLAGVVEAIFAEKMEWLLLPLLYYHFDDRWFARTGIGLELGREDDEQDIKAHLIWRLGAGYVIPIKEFRLVPSLDWDMVRTDPSLAYGLVLAREF